MLNRLEISNYALIENVALELHSGFTVITGETGAGKSILLKALNLLMGQRADTSVLRQNEKKCYLEAEFGIAKLQIKDFFERNDLDYENDCVVRREFTASGKSRCFVNDTPVSVNVLKELGEKLISIHSQHQSLDVFSSSFQMELIDHFSGIEKEVNEYRSKFRLYRKKVDQRIELILKDKESRKEKDYLEFLLKELEEAQLEDSNLEELQLRSAKIENAEKINESIRFIDSVFSNENYGPYNGIHSILESLDDLKKMDSGYVDLAARMLSIKIELNDIESEIAQKAGEFDFSEEDAQIVRDKIEKFNSLLYKHNLTDLEQLIELKSKISGQLSDIQLVEDELSTIDDEIKQLEQDLHQRATTIGKARRKRLSELEKLVSEKLSHLAMPDAELKIELQPKEQLGSNGLDEIEFLFKTNLGGQFSPLKKVASGGELSRLMLTILSIMSANKNLPTLIFDEIDTGVSGEVAAKIASEFQRMGEQIQLIAITHLAQVAGKGANHLHVSKSSSSDKTTTSVNNLKGEERITELAKMISGETITDAARENAINLLKTV